MRISISLWAIWVVWLRYYSVFIKSLPYYLATTFLEPILYLASFGLGVGSLVGNVRVDGLELSYRSFIFSGIIAQTVLFQGFYEGAFGAFVRMYYQRIFQAIAITPITLNELLWGELFWDASKATFAGMVVGLIGVLVGEFKFVSLFLLLPLIFIGSFLFSAMGLASAAYSRSIDHLAYPQYLFVFPMFLFCGVFYPIDALPEYLRMFVWIFPLTSLVSLIRTLTLELPFEAQTIPLLLFWLVVLVYVSHRAMYRRLVK
jgi:lipooligosaccharide transport system permease protein